MTILGLKTIRGLTDALFRRYGPFQDAEEYFRRYSIAGDALKNLSVPTTIIGARDDPAIPIRDFSGLRPGPGARLIIHEFGGHNGFLNGVFNPPGTSTRHSRPLRRHPEGYVFRTLGAPACKPRHICAPVLKVPRLPLITK